MRRPNQIKDRDLPIPLCIKSKNFSEILPLIELCGHGKLYEVEEWIIAGKPLQGEPPDDRKLQRLLTPLEIAAAKGFHSLAGLLLANGYDPNGDDRSPLTEPVRSRDREMVVLLLKFGANPNDADFCEVLETYDRNLMDLFIEAGVDPCNGNAVARALSHKGRPLLGFVKSYQDRFPKMQRQIDIALNVFVDRRDEKGIALMLWLGADPHDRVPNSAYPEDAELCEVESPFERALWVDRENVIESFLKKPMPPEQVEYLFKRVSYRRLPNVVRRLLKEGANPNHTEEERHIIEDFAYPILSPWNSSVIDRDVRAVEAMEIVIEAGAKWDPSPERLAYFRRRLLKGEPQKVRKVLELFEKHEVLCAEQLKELTRTPSMKQLLQRDLPQNQAINSAFRSDGASRTNSPRYRKKH